MQSSGEIRRENAESHPHYCHAPRRRGIQYAAASRLKHGLWNTGSPAFAGDDNPEPAV
jgi:hypothetical protein